MIRVNENQQAQRVNAEFAITEHNARHINRLCRMVDGLPLALELAAAWTDSLSPAAIAEEIERSLDILTVDLRDLPPRHRSMRVVLDTTWQRLSLATRQVLAALSIFRGPFNGDAAAAVAGATPKILAQIVSYSLLTLTTSRNATNCMNCCANTARKS